VVFILDLIQECLVIHGFSANAKCRDCALPSRGGRHAHCLLALTISAFAIGTTEFVIVGLIPTIAADLGTACPRPGCWSACTRWAWPSARRCSPR
jgi:hypothetical protein